MSPEKDPALITLWDRLLAELASQVAKARVSCDTTARSIVRWTKVLAAATVGLAARPRTMLTVDSTGPLHFSATTSAGGRLRPCSQLELRSVIRSCRS